MIEITRDYYEWIDDFEGQVSAWFSEVQDSDLFGILKEMVTLYTEVYSLMGSDHYLNHPLIHTVIASILIYVF